MRRLLCVLGLLAATARIAAAQYFGQNQIQYRTFAFQVLRTENFDIHFYPEERDAVEMAARMAERWRARLTSVMGHELRGRQPLILYAAHAHFQQTNAISGGVGEGTGGVTESFKRRIVLPFTVSLAESDHVIGHELVHAFQYDMTGRGRSAAPGVAGLPLWFVEGMAEYLSIGPVDPTTATWLRDAMLQNRLPKIRDLDNWRYFPYRYGHAFWAFIGGRYGDESIGRVLRAASRTGDPYTALASVLAVDVDSLSAQWHLAMREQWEPLRAGTDSIAAGAEAILTRQTTDGRLNVGPVLSPDGSRIAFLSERDLFSIDLFVADAQTGRVQRKITSTALDEHFESLQFINSAGSWHPDGRRFVLAAQVRGEAALNVVNMDNGRREQDFRLGIDDASNPSWSPDGSKVVFSGQSGGLTDLYTLDVASGQIQRLTNDAFADLQPAWSPDGRTIAFVTDRYGTDLNTLRYGNYRLAFLDVASGRVTQAPTFPRGKHINPQWGGEGRLYFLADPDGITNVYRMDVASGAMTRVTNLFTGVGGIATLSPALSASSGADRVAFSVQRENDIEVFRLDQASTAGTAAVAVTEDRLARVAVLPPDNSTRLPSHVAAYLGDERAGLMPSDSFAVRRYSPRFGLDYISQPSLAVGVDRFGTYVGGGAALYWSSMLGERQLLTALQVNGGFRDIAAQVAYINLKSRLDWAVQAGQQPYVQRFLASGFDGSTGEGVDQVVTQRQLNQQASFQVAYPFSRVRRMEFQLGGRRLSFSQDIHETRYDPVTGVITSESRSSQSIGEPIVLGEASVATVFDNSVFGGTGPVIGGRYRIEAAPTVGSINYVAALADFRKYLMPVRPVTLAGRLMHYGRYGSGGDDPRFTPMFIGYQSLVRGYDDGSFTISECGGAVNGSCPIIDRLLGSRMLIGNLELRVPMLGPLGILTKTFLPVDFALFADAGVAWNSGEQPFQGAREMVTSVGAGLRVNLFGMFIGEIDVVNPLDRPGKGWYVQFGLNPGF